MLTGKLSQQKYPLCAELGGRPCSMVLQLADCDWICYTGLRADHSRCVYRGVRTATASARDSTDPARNPGRSSDGPLHLLQPTTPGWANCYR